MHRALFLGEGLLAHHLTAPICLPGVGSTPSGHLRGAIAPPFLPPPLPRPPSPPPPISITSIALSLPSSVILLKVTSAPSERVRKPSDLMADWWTKRSSPPEEGVMKPKPFCELNLRAMARKARPGNI